MTVTTCPQLYSLFLRVSGFARSMFTCPPDSRYVDATWSYLPTRIDSLTPVPHYGSQLCQEIAYRDIAIPVAMSARPSVSRSLTLWDLLPHVSTDGRFRSSRLLSSQHTLKKSLPNSTFWVPLIVYFRTMLFPLIFVFYNFSLIL
jgi:hypothetical protein